MTITFFIPNHYEEVKAILVDGGLFDDTWDSRTHWLNKIKQDPKSILVALDNDKVIGCLLIIRDAWTCFLYRLAVHKDYRGKGVGSTLLATAEAALREEGADEVAIFVDSENEELQSYYEKRGYIKGGGYRCMYKKLQE